MIKRSFDLLLSMVGLILASPFFLVVAIAIKLDSSGPVFFRQERIGQGGVPFRIFKFRSMRVEPQQGKQLTIGNDTRITKVGRIIRKTKMDELPQLLNIFIGEMSFVGPRPEVPKYVAFYSEAERFVLTAKPGITDLASIRYRNENDVLALQSNPEEYYIQKILPDKLRLSTIYIRHQSLWLDVKIIIATLYAVITDKEEMVLDKFFSKLIK